MALRFSFGLLQNQQSCFVSPSKLAVIDEQGLQELTMEDILDDHKLDITFEDKHTVRQISYRSDRQRGLRKISIKQRWLIQDKCLGSGSFGSVRLHCTEDGQQRAVKAVLKSRAEKSGIDYKEEIRALTKFSGPKYSQQGIFVDFLGWYDNDDFVFLAMEYFPMGDLGHLAGREKNEADVKAICNQLLEGLEIMHTNGFMHRDLKPQNIFVVQIQPWWIKIGDFGITKRAKPIPGTIRMGTHIGTEGYTAPEVDPDFAEILGCGADRQGNQTGKPYVYTNAVDIWSLGCVLYQLVASRLPFSPMSPKILKRFCKGKTPFPKDALNSKIHEDGIELIQKFLSPKPQFRPSASQARDSNWLKEMDKQDIGGAPFTLPSELNMSNLGVEPLMEEKNSKTVVPRFKEKSDTSALPAMKAVGENQNQPLPPTLPETQPLFSHFRADDNEGLEEILTENAPKTTINRRLSRATTSENITTQVNSVSTTKSGKRLSIQEQDEEILYPTPADAEAEFGLKNPDNDKVANLASILEGDEKGDEHYSQILEASEAEFGLEHYKTLRIVRDFIPVLMGREKIKEAEKLCRRVLVEVVVKLGIEHEETLSMSFILASLLYSQNRDTEARALCHDVLERTKVKHNGVLNEIFVLSKSLVKIGKDNEIEVLCKRALEGFQEGLDSENYLEVLCILALAIFKQGKEDEAEGVFREALAEAAVKPGDKYYIALKEAINPPPGEQNHNCVELLHAASRDGHEAMIKILLGVGLDINATDEKGMTALHAAAKSGKELVAKLLLDRGVDIEAKSNTGWTPLHSAARKGHEVVVKLLLEKGANIEAKSNDGGTPLHCAAGYGHEAVVKLLLEKGANIEAKSNEGWTPLHSAAERGHEVVVELLLEKGANIEAKSNEGWAPLHFAAIRGHEVVVKLLLEKGANSEAKNDKGWTPLHAAASYGHEAVVKLLLEKGANIRAKSNGGLTSLHSAAERGREVVVELLLEKGANIEAKSNEGWTPLHFAAIRGHEVVVKLLLEKGANIEAKSNGGLTSLHSAVYWGHEAIVRVLLEAGAQIEAKNSDGMTALSLASKNKHGSIEQLLLRSGAKRSWTRRITQGVW